jgi:magnesium transporter
VRPRAPRAAPGSEPGTLYSDPEAAPPRVTVIAYGPLELTECPVDDLALLERMRGNWPVLWVNVDGVGHAPTIAEVGRIFGLHRLALEDLGDVQQRPKAEVYDDSHLFVSARMARMTPELDLEHMGIFLGPDYVVTFQERQGDPLEPVRQRIRLSRGRIRRSGPDYLAYAVLDAIVDNYFPVAEAYADSLDALEDEVLGRPGRATMERLHRTRRELMSLRRAAWPMRDAITILLREPMPLFTGETLVYLRDTQDHCVQVVELVDQYRELGASLTDLYLSSVSNRMNEVMKVLTIFSAVFIPLSFISGIFGMNVDHPDPVWWWNLPFAVGVMAGTAAMVLLWVASRGWVGNDRGG